MTSIRHGILPRLLLQPTPLIHPHPAASEALPATSQRLPLPQNLFGNDWDSYDRKGKGHLRGVMEEARMAPEGSERYGSVSEAAERASDASGWASEAAGKAPDAAGSAGRQTGKITEGILVCDDIIGHCPPTGPLFKKGCSCRRALL